MAVNSRKYLTVTPFLPLNSPPYTDAQSFNKFLVRQLQSIRQTLADLTEAAPQATDTAPLNPRIGTIRYAVGAWATSLGAEGWYGYKATGGWTLIS